MFENQHLKEETFSAILDVVDVSCKVHHKQISSDPSFHVKSMFYIILIATKRKVFVLIGFFYGGSTISRANVMFYPLYFMH